MDFEAAEAELVQTDSELAAAYTAYTEARRRLNEKVRHRGFWPVSQKGKSRGSKGVKGKLSKGHGSSRKSLQARILESRCRLCNQVGHWQAECPNRRDGASSASRPPQAPTTFTGVMDSVTGSDDALPLEFLNLPTIHEPTLDDIQPAFASVMMLEHGSTPKDRLRGSLSPKSMENVNPAHLCRLQEK